MAGARGNTAWLMWARQTGGKGMASGAGASIAAPGAAIAGAYKAPFSGGNIGPDRAIDQLAETDASRDQGVSFVRTAGVSGSPECYVRDASVGSLLQAVLGTDTPGGTTPNFTHTITPAQTIPYLTMWKNLGDVLWEKYVDCFVSSLTVRAGAGDPLTAAFSVQGLTSTRLNADPDPLPTPVVALQNGYVYNYNDCTVNLAGGSTGLVSSFELTIDNNVTRQQTDDFVPYDLVVGQRQVSLSFDILFENYAEYAKFHYGSASGTTQSKTLYTTNADFQFDGQTANNQIKFTLPTIAYEEYDPAPNTGGDPVSVSVRAVAQRPSSGSILTAFLKNQVAIY